MKTWLMGVLMAAVAVSFMPGESQAKRLAGGKPAGMQRDMPARTAPDAPAPKPATPQQAAPATPATAGAAPAAAAPKRSWMGPLAGLAAGLGIAALMSHFGMGEAMGNFLMMALLAVAAFFVIRWAMNRFGPRRNAEPAMAYTGNAGNAGTPAQVAWPAPAGAAAPAPVLDAPAAPAAAAPVTAAPITAAFVPASFDAESFERTARMIFIRLQAANDIADLNDLRNFTTPEMFATLRLDLQDRGDQKQQTDVLRVDAKVLDVAQEGQQQIVSVRFHGEVREEAGAPATAFDEVWHLVKPVDDSRSWAIAGIEQKA